jgi:hypothetical protein
MTMVAGVWEEWFCHLPGGSGYRAGYVVAVRLLAGNG